LDFAVPLADIEDACDDCAPRGVPPCSLNRFRNGMSSDASLPSGDGVLAPSDPGVTARPKGVKLLNPLDETAPDDARRRSFR